MSGKRVMVGIDTSNYRTSLCLMDEDKKVLADLRQLLEVEAGERGLMQSEAVFAHLKNLPALVRQIRWEQYHIQGIAVSTAPRPVEGSYMPVFQVGWQFATVLSAVLQVPLWETTHQEGHLAAAVWNLPHFPEQEPFLALHLSGGTTDILAVQKTERGYSIRQVGGSQDLHVGQMVDRVGVALGLPFPAGPELERLARQSVSPVAIPSAVRGTWMSFSGPDSHARRLVERGANPADVARGVEASVARSIEKALRNLWQEGDYPKTVLFVGGVAANRWIRERLQQRLTHPAVGAKLYFADVRYSGDNACGVAYIGWQRYRLNHIFGQ